MKILLWFDKLPFYHQYTIGSRSHFCVDVYLPTSETSNYLKILKNLKQYTDEMLVQFVVGGTHKGYDHLIETFDEESGSWSLPYAEFVKTLDDISKKAG